MHITPVGSRTDMDARSLASYQVKSSEWRARDLMSKERFAAPA
jgi:hypothetical protein